MARAKIQRFLDTLDTFDHEEGMRLFDEAVVNRESAETAVLGLLLAAANHHDKDPVTPHGLHTAAAAYDMFRVAGWPASLPVIRFLAIYNFTLTHRNWTPGALERMARKLQVAAGADLRESLRRAMAARKPEEAAAVAVRLATQEGIDVAGSALVSATLGDIGRLHHNFSLAVAYADAARALGDRAGLVALANGAFEIAVWMNEYKIPELESLDGAGTPSLIRLEDALGLDDFDTVHVQLRNFAASETPEDGLRPLLVSACLEAGFLGHSMIAAHAARRAMRYLTPEERAFLLWKFYRILVKAFGFPVGLEFGTGSEVAPEPALEALKASLKMKTPPVERTLRTALEAGVPLDKILQHVVYNWTHWTVGEKEHTVAYLNAAVQTAAFLGREQAMVPLVSALYKLPF